MFAAISRRRGDAFSLVGSVESLCARQGVQCGLGDLEIFLTGLRADTDARSWRMIEVIPGGSFLARTACQEGSFATRIRHDLDATLRPYLGR